MNTTRTPYKGYTITHEFPGQWEVTASRNPLREGWMPEVHLFDSLKTAKAWIDCRVSHPKSTARTP